MKISQQIVGVNQRLGNTAVPNMQGTTRSIFDSRANAAVTDQTLTFFSGVSSRPYPLSNINSNKFEVGESLAITQISAFVRPTSFGDPALISTAISTLFSGAVNTNSCALLLNLYIGNQRVIKDLDLNYGRFNLGESMNPGDTPFTVKFETPIVIPPQIEFYVTLRQMLQSAALVTNQTVLVLSGQGTLLNTKSSF
jgi:hypothetical protein